MPNVEVLNILSHISISTGLPYKSRHGWHTFERAFDNDVKILYLVNVLGHAQSTIGVIIQFTVANTALYKKSMITYKDLKKRRIAVLHNQIHNFELYFGCGKQKQYLTLPNDRDELICRIERAIGFPMPDNIDQHILSMATSRLLPFGHHSFTLPYYFWMKGDMARAHAAAQFFFPKMYDFPDEQRKSYLDWLGTMGVVL